MALSADLKQIDENSLVDQECCPVCGDDLDDCKALFTLQEMPVTVEMRQCQNCFAASAAAMPTNEHLHKVYDPSHYQATLTNIHWLVELLAERVVKNFQLGNRKSIQVLDYGGGNDKLASEVVKQLAVKYPAIKDIKATIVDLYLEPNTEILEFILVDDFLKSDEMYDIVLASAVLEHIPNLQFIFKRLMNAGTPGALFYARTPFEAPLVKLLPFHKINWPIHVHDIGPDFWDNLTSRHDGIKVLKSQTSIVESSFSNAFARTTVAHILKFPSRIETGIIKKLIPYKKCYWRLVGGWEVFLLLNMDSHKS